MSGCGQVWSFPTQENGRLRGERDEAANERGLLLSSHGRLLARRAIAAALLSRREAAEVDLRER